MSLETLRTDLLTQILRKPDPLNQSDPVCWALWCRQKSVAWQTVVKRSRLDFMLPWKQAPVFKQVSKKRWDRVQSRQHAWCIPSINPLHGANTDSKSAQTSETLPQERVEAADYKLTLSETRSYWGINKATAKSQQLKCYSYKSSRLWNNGLRQNISRHKPVDQYRRTWQNMEKEGASPE